MVGPFGMRLLPLCFDRVMVPLRISLQFAPQSGVGGVQGADVVEEDGGSGLDLVGGEHSDRLVLAHGESRVPDAVVVHQGRNLVNALQKNLSRFTSVKESRKSRKINKSHNSHNQQVHRTCKTPGRISKLLVMMTPTVWSTYGQTS